MNLLKSNLGKSLQCVLADCYALFLKTQNYHWNVSGERFYALHAAFEGQYKDLFNAIDTVAELIRGIGCKPVATFDGYKSTTKIHNGNESANANEMLDDLLKDQSIMEETLLEALKEAEIVHDEVVISFLVDRMTAHRKNAWMLKSSM